MGLSSLLGFGLFLEVGAVGFLVGLNVGDTALGVTDGVELLSFR